ncbi:glycosyltransferase [Roseateles sp.]|uniref:glycosyltransferase n=1 Tax=Roseateles sp. TaxID=1971397 RepID=UPI0025EF74DF|nr:glycosyltransferase [Roseateles sp.]MBV8033896.1 glycosyltransferase [Roseateles sp.]
MQSGTQPMRIFFLMYDALPPFRSDVKVLFGQELPKLGVLSDVAGQAGGGLDATGSWGGGVMHVTGPLRKGLVGELVRPFQDLLAMRRLESEHQVIQVRDKIRTGLLAWIVARLTGRRFVYWMSFPFAEGHAVRARDVGFTKGPIVWIANWARAQLAQQVFYRFLIKRVDHLFVQSDEMCREMREHGVPAARMTAVPMGVNSEWFDRDRAAMAGDVPEPLRGRRVLAYVGTLARSRRPEFLVQVLERVREVEPGAFLLLIGDAPNSDERAWLREMIASSSSASSIHLTGWVDQDTAQRWLAHAELGYSPFPRGPLLDSASPTKAIEYLAQGIPCVANDNPDQQLVLTQSGGGFCVPMEVEAFAHASMRLLSDPPMATKMGSAGKAWVQQHRDYSVLARQVASVYERLCPSAGPPQQEQMR